MNNTYINHIVSNIVNNLADEHIQRAHLNVLITGAAGAGRHSTVNAILKKDVALVGADIDEGIERYDDTMMTLWVAPGMGYGDADKKHKADIISKLMERKADGSYSIDVVLVIIDGSSRDLGTSYQLIHDVLTPHLAGRRLIAGINQADMAMKGRGWDYEQNLPTPLLQRFLEEKRQSVKTRIKEATDMELEPICYCAGFKEDDEEQMPYNIETLIKALQKEPAATTVTSTATAEDTDMVKAACITEGKEASPEQQASQSTDVKLEYKRPSEVHEKETDRFKHDIILLVASMLETFAKFLRAISR